MTTFLSNAWYLNIIFILIILATIFWQTYYCSLLCNLELRDKKRVFVREGLVILLLMVLLYFVELRHTHYLFLCLLPFIWFRIWVNFRDYQKLVYKDINYQTYKQAWDALPVAVAIADENLIPVLVNARMYEFLGKKVHRKMRNLLHFWNYLQKVQRQDLQVTQEKQHLVLKFADGSIYWAELEKLVVEDQDYWQLTITELDKQDNLLQEENMQLLSDEKQGLKRLLRSLEEIKRQEVLEEIHGRVHDFMGQRIAALERLLSQKDTADFSALVPMLENVLQDLRTSTLQSNEEQLQNIVDSFTTMGLGLKIEGTLPSNSEWAVCFVNMIREGATNAVRHGDATEVVVAMEQSAGQAKITITSDGRVPQKLEKGNGLKNMENALQKLGGSLEISMQDKFILQGKIGVN